jgi:hypothetical protein
LPKYQIIVLTKYQNINTSNVNKLSLGGFVYKKMLLLMAGVALIAGCGHVTGGVSPSSIPLAPNSYTELGSVRGNDCVYYLLGFIPLRGGNETKNALADALAQKPEAKALVNITSDSYSMNFIIFSQICTQVDGIAVSLK